jgi:hypothetical protein
MIDTNARTAFWEVIEDCLVKIHQKPEIWAQSQTRAFRGDVETGSFPAGDLIYHEEPFDLACAIAKIPEPDVDPLFASYFVEYEKILKKRGW